MIANPIVSAEIRRNSPIALLAVHPSRQKLVGTRQDTLAETWESNPT